MAAVPRIEEYRFGHITIDGRRYSDDVIIRPCSVDDSWWRDEGHLLQTQDLDDALVPPPEVLVVGTGANGRMQIADDVEDWLTERGIELVAVPTGEAVQRYNELAGQRRTVAALHLTC